MAQIAVGRYGNVGEYFWDLVRGDQEHREAAMAELQTVLELAETSGVFDNAYPDILEAARQEARQKGLLHDKN